MAGWTSAIVRLEEWNRMVTKGYRKGVYEWVTLGTGGSGRLRLLIQKRYGGAGAVECRLSAALGTLGSSTMEEIQTMTWIKTVPLTEVDEKLRSAMEGQRALYPVEYATPVHPDESGGSTIVGSHTLIPEALYHAFGTFGALMSPELPLSRRQHEMIATMVSVTNRCVY